jgi:hypothetical protein
LSLRAACCLRLLPSCDDPVQRDVKRSRDWPAIAPEEGELGAPQVSWRQRGRRVWHEPGGGFAQVLKAHSGGTAPARDNRRSFDPPVRRMDSKASRASSQWLCRRPARLCGRHGTASTGSDPVTPGARGRLVRPSPAAKREPCAVTAPGGPIRGGRRALLAAAMRPRMDCVPRELFGESPRRGRRGRCRHRLDDDCRATGKVTAPGGGKKPALPAR